MLISRKNLLGYFSIGLEIKMWNGLDYQLLRIHFETSTGQTLILHVTSTMILWESHYSMFLVKFGVRHQNKPKVEKTTYFSLFRNKKVDNRVLDNFPSFYT